MTLPPPPLRVRAERGWVTADALELDANARKIMRDETQNPVARAMGNVLLHLLEEREDLYEAMRAVLREAEGQDPIAAAESRPLGRVRDLLGIEPD